MLIRECDNCDGAGKYWAMSGDSDCPVVDCEICDNCGGSGVVGIYPAFIQSWGRLVYRVNRIFNPADEIPF